MSEQESEHGLTESEMLLVDRWDALGTDVQFTRTTLNGVDVLVGCHIEGPDIFPVFVLVNDEVMQMLAPPEGTEEASDNQEDGG